MPALAAVIFPNRIQHHRHDENLYEARGKQMLIAWVVEAAWEHRECKDEEA